MKRRTLLKWSLIPAILLLGSGHTPYRQWSVYRKKHLLILTDKTQPGSFELGQQLVNTLVTHLPSSKARVTRAPDRERVASLLSSQQLDVALMTRDDAVALAGGKLPFASYEPVPLRILIASGDFLLVCRDDFPDQYAYLTSKTLIEHGDPALNIILPDTTQLPILSLHPGTTAYSEGQLLPDYSPAAEPDHDHDHHHEKKY